ncbi:unnamed protein product [Ectocarpus sp. 6 AP-2014]
MSTRMTGVLCSDRGKRTVVVFSLFRHRGEFFGIGVNFSTQIPGAHKGAMMHIGQAQQHSSLASASASICFRHTKNARACDARVGAVLLRTKLLASCKLLESCWQAGGL